MDPELTGESLELWEFVNNPAAKIVMHLAQNVIPGEVDTVALGDFTECNFPGYAPIRLTEWDALETANDNLGDVASSYVEFIAEAIETPQLITAVYVTIQDGTGPIYLMWVYYLDQPLLVGEAGHMYRKRCRITSLADLAA